MLLKEDDGTFYNKIILFHSQMDGWMVGTPCNLRLIDYILSQEFYRVSLENIKRNFSLHNNKKTSESLLS